MPLNIRNRRYEQHPETGAVVTKEEADAARAKKLAKAQAAQADREQAQRATAFEELTDSANAYMQNAPYAEAKAELIAKAAKLGLLEDDAREAAAQAYDTNSWAVPPSEDGTESRLETIRATEVTVRPVDWLWYGRIPRGKLTLIVGDPDGGKTTVAVDIAARLTTGATWPDGGVGTQGNVLFISSEDDSGDTLKPRLIAANANLARVHFYRGFQRRAGKESAFQPATFSLGEVEALRHRVRAIGNVAAVFLDPISAFVGKVDAHRNAEVRGLLAPLVDLAARQRFAIIGIDHLNKGQAAAPLYRSMGSIGWMAQSRAAFLIARDVEDEHGRRRLFLRLKGNLAPDPGGLAFEIEQKQLSELVGRTAPRIAWEDGTLTTTAMEVLTRPSTLRHTKKDEAIEFLRELLMHGEVSAGAAIKDAADHGFSKTAIQRARQSLGVITRKDGQGGWFWRLKGSPSSMESSDSSDSLKPFKLKYKNPKEPNNSKSLKKPRSKE